CFALSDRADAPPAEERLSQKLLRDTARPVWPGYAGEEQMSRVGSPHLTGALLAIERERVSADVLAPERLLEPVPQAVRFLLQRDGKGPVSELAREIGACPLRGIDIALHLA